MLSLIYRLLYLILHLLASVYEWLRWVYLRLHALMLRSYDCFHGQALIEQEEADFLARCKLQLNKIPRHLNVVIGPQDTHTNEAVLSRIVRFSLIMGIDCVSFYDTRRAESGKVFISKLARPKAVLCNQVQERHVVWNMSTSVAAVNGKKPYATNGATNGYANGSTVNGNGQACHESMDRSIEIFELTPNDGRPLIVEVCRELFAQRHSAKTQHLLKDRARLSEYISNTLSQRLHGLPDPDLSIIFSRHLCTFGMLPWQTRFTEFHKLESDRYFDAATFAQVLYKYARCEQRWGK